MYVVFEGPDGAGKTTAVSAVAELLRKELPGEVVRSIREPSDLPLGRAALSYLSSHASEGGSTADPYVAALAMVAQRVDLLGSIDLKSGVTLSDRSFLTTYVYQDVVGQRVLDAIHGFVILRSRRKVPLPDLVVHLRISPEETLARAKVRGKEIWSADEIRRVAELYDTVIGRWNELHPRHLLTVLPIDTATCSAEDVAERVADVVSILVRTRRGSLSVLDGLSLPPDSRS